jgi:molybdopterin converting factor subunit 1
MKVRVKLFAVARELAGQDELTLDVQEGTTLADVRRAVELACPALKRIMPHALWAVGAEYASDNIEVSDQSDVALIPPVSGG